MTDTVDTVVEVNDDLDAFSNDLFGTPEAPKAEKEEVDEVDTPSTETDSDESTGDDTPADEDDDKDEDKDADGQPKPKPRKSARERIDEVTAARRLAERERDAERRDNDELRRRLEALEAKNTPQSDAKPTVDESPDPDEKDDRGELKYPLGEFDPAYIRDLTRYTIKVEREALEADALKRLEAEEKTESEQELLDDWTGRLNDGFERMPELRDNAAALEDTFRNIDEEYGQFLATTIMSMEYGPEVLNYLGENLDEAQEIVSKGATRAAIALGRIEGRFADNKVEKEKVIPTKAPEPAPTLRGSGGRFSVAPDTDDLDAFEKAYFKKK